MLYVQSVAQKRAASRLDVKTSTVEHACEDGPLIAAFPRRQCVYVAHAQMNAVEGTQGQLFVFPLVAQTEAGEA
jgi:hypothetical protein